MKPSILMKQHIGELEGQIEVLKSTTAYQDLAAEGVGLYDGIHARDEVTGVSYSPKGATWDLTQYENKNDVFMQRVMHVQGLYFKYLEHVSYELAIQLMQLGAVREDYASKQKHELFYTSRRLYWVNHNGIWVIIVKAVNNTWVTYDVIGSGKDCVVPSIETYTRRIPTLDVYETYEEALKNSGRCV